MFDQPERPEPETPTDVGTAATYQAVAADDLDELLEAAVQVQCVENLARLELVRMVAVFAAKDVWRADGQTGMIPWLGCRHGLRRRTAREIVDVAAVIGDLPCLAAAFGRGALSWDQLVPLCELADADSDRSWAEEGPGHSPEDLARMVRTRQVSDADARTIHERRGIGYRRCRTGGSRIHGFIPDDMCDTVMGALDRIFDTQIGPDPLTGLYPTGPQRRADALALLAGYRLGADPDPDRATVVVHGDIGLLTGEDKNGHATLADLTPIAAATFQRLACDGRIEWAVDGPDGLTIGIARASRQWPSWLARQIRNRDGERCRFPGCNRPINQIHHKREWGADKGETSDANGVGLCWAHHHYVHEGGWTIQGDPRDELTFISPWGQHLHSHPRRLSPQVKKQIRGILPDRGPPN